MYATTKQRIATNSLGPESNHFHNQLSSSQVTEAGSLIFKVVYIVAMASPSHQCLLGISSNSLEPT